MQGQCLSSQLSFLFFSLGEWVGSKALTHQRVPFSPFIGTPASQFAVFLFSPHLSATCLSISPVCSLHHYFNWRSGVFALLLLRSFHFPSWLCDLCPLLPCNPLSPLSLSSCCLFISPFCIFPLSSHAFFSYTFPPLFPLHSIFFHFLFITFLPYTTYTFPSFHLFVSLLITFCPPCS